MQVSISLCCLSLPCCSNDSVLASEFAEVRRRRSPIYPVPWKVTIFAPCQTRSRCKNIAFAGDGGRCSELSLSISFAPPRYQVMQTLARRSQRRIAVALYETHCRKGIPLSRRIEVAMITLLLTFGDSIDVCWIKNTAPVCEPPPF